MTCDTYWKTLGWNPPNSKNTDLQKFFGLCNYVCGHSSHQDKKEIVYCAANVFHSTSFDYSEHKFNCVHKESINHDIIFIVDCTGSMRESFPQVKNVINNIFEKWGNEQNKFAVVGYTDHHPHNGHFPKNNHVSIFPPSKKLDDGNAAGAANFIGNMETGGGGDNYGEALIDGLAEANNLMFRKDSSKIYIVVCDDSPHGPEFSSKTEYPEGCPCGHKWTDLLGVMKIKNVKFIFVKLAERLNKTIKVFQESYGHNMTVMHLNDVRELGFKVTDTVMLTIENNYVFSTKLRKSNIS